MICINDGCQWRGDDKREPNDKRQNKRRSGEKKNKKGAYEPQIVAQMMPIEPFTFLVDYL